MNIAIALFRVRLERLHVLAGAVALAATACGALPRATAFASPGFRRRARRVQSGASVGHLRSLRPQPCSRRRRALCLLRTWVVNRPSLGPTSALGVDVERTWAHSLYQSTACFKPGTAVQQSEVFAILSSSTFLDPTCVWLETRGLGVSPECNPVSPHSSSRIS